ncbi:MAG: hypothetical protein KGL39_41515 [Patescibacteria group bacterium]|nr:hypothetical protein [Patescibacteria group bacterium]
MQKQVNAALLALQGARNSIYEATITLSDGTNMPIDLSGATAARMQVKNTYTSPAIFTLTETANANGSVLGAPTAQGTIDITIAQADMALVSTSTSGFVDCVWDLLVIDIHGNPIGYVGGVFRIFTGVTSPS